MGDETREGVGNTLGELENLLVEVNLKVASTNTHAQQGENSLGLKRWFQGTQSACLLEERVLLLADLILESGLNGFRVVIGITAFLTDVLEDVLLSLDLGVGNAQEAGLDKVDLFILKRSSNYARTALMEQAMKVENGRLDTLCLVPIRSIMIDEFG